MSAATQDLAELIKIEPANALATFTTAGDAPGKHAGLDPILALIRARIDAFEPDMASDKGRKQIASMAFAVARSKSAIEDIGEGLAREAKALPKKIDAGRKYARDILDDWRDEVRKPLTEWEAAEEARIKRHVDAIAAIERAGTPWPNATVADLRESIATVESAGQGHALEEFADEYRIAKESALRALREALARRETYEAEQAELATLRAERTVREAREAAERAEADRLEQLEREAETAAREAAIAAKRATEEAERKAAAELAAAEARARAEREAAQRREADLKAQTEAAEKRAAETEARIKREAAEAAEREAAEVRRREADREHRATVNRAAVVALVAASIPEDTAKTVISLIAKRAIPAVSISY